MTRAGGPPVAARTRGFSRPAVRRAVLLAGLVAVIALGFGLRSLLVEAAPDGHGDAWWLVATAFVAVIVPITQPGLERLADRAAYGAAGDPYAVMNEFVRRASEALAIDDVLPQLAQTASRAVGSPHGEVELQLADGGAWRESWPPAYPDEPLNLPSRDRLSVPLQHGGIALGRLTIDQEDRELGRQDRDLLERLAGPAGVAVSNVRLTVELRRQLAQTSALAEQLRRSRDRLVAARAVQQQQFTADVTDRVLRHWRGVELALAGDACGPAQLDAARKAATAALASLRVLAHGVFPPALLGSGLPAALDQFLDETSLPVEVTAEPFGSATAAEIVLYFAVAALLPAMASAGMVSVILRHTRGARGLPAVLAELRGGTQPSEGTELYVRDRLEARGGHMSVRLDSSAVVAVVLEVPQEEVA